jgi:Ran GTPase-activating protein (RanGAP) involved in mRNA processing and transport
LDLRSNNIGYSGAQALAEALKNPKCRLTSLNLNNNNMVGDLGAQALAEALKNPNCKLTSLDLYHTNISDLGAKALAEALKNPNCKLTSLVLPDRISSSGIKALAEAQVFLKHNGRHISIRIEGVLNYGVYLEQAEKAYNGHANRQSGSTCVMCQ